MLDTNIVIYTIKNRPEKVRALFNQYCDELCISSIVYMELIYGIEKSSKPEQNLKDVDGLISRLQLLSYDPQAAEHSGQIRAELAKKGNSIGPYDLMIAGHARSKGYILVTNNEKEFKRVSGLRVENWVN